MEEMKSKLGSSAEELEEIYAFRDLVIDKGWAMVPRRFLQSVLDTLYVSDIIVQPADMSGFWFLVRRSNREEK